ncbi:MAG TPA: GNAT family N-acetyltransferase [Chitinophagaceae bacterium]|nr:GNAT family N-acetyltransferase [Chitinophagaceae bacterium]
MLAINFNPFPELATARLRFRQLTADDAQQIYELRSDETVNRFLPRKRCENLDEAASFINKINRGISNNEAMYWAITFRDADKLIGSICLWNLQPDNHRAEIGYELKPEHWGTGIMREALPRVIKYATETLGLHSIQADTNPENVHSVTLLEKSGFVKEGHFRESILFNGRYSDMVVYTFINRAPQAAK